MPAPSHHFVTVCANITSHNRLHLQLALNLLDLHPSLCITLLYPASVAPAFGHELDLQPRSLVNRVGSRMRMESLDDAGISSHWLEELGRYKKNLEGRIEELLIAKDGWSPPGLFLADLFACEHTWIVAKQLASHGLPRVPVFHVNTSFAVGYHRYYTTDDEGAPGPRMRSRYNEYIRDGMSESEAIKKAFRRAENRLLTYPDLPPMYDYEFTPQSDSRSTLTPSALLTQDAQMGAARNVDGCVFLSVPELESDSLQYMERVMGIPVVGLGPQLSDGMWLPAPESSTRSIPRPEDIQIISFLDLCLSQYGSNSVLYISFGTSAWPVNRPRLIGVILESLLAAEPPLPFVFARGTNQEGLGDAILRKIRASGRGILVEWAPQMRVLKHEAVGMFLVSLAPSYNSSLMESIIAGVPIVALPFIADQPALAAYYVQVQHIGVQLYQLSSGLDGLALGNGVHIESTEENMRCELTETWERMRGTDGAEFRRNTERVREQMRRSIHEGLARANMLGLSKYFS